jgi:hypothetical protein
MSSSVSDIGSNDDAYEMLRLYRCGGRDTYKIIKGFEVIPGLIRQFIKKNVLSDSTFIDPSWKLVKKPSQEWMEEFVYNSDETHIVRKELKLETDEKVVLTHDNGDRAFLVVYSPTYVTVYARPFDEYIWEEDYSTDMKKNWSLYTQKVEQFRVYKSWIPGKKGEKGNSVLFRVSETENEYLFVGHSVFTFTTDEPIVEYISNVGNSDVPYPYALGVNRVYFMLDRKWVHRRDITSLDPYREYYDKRGVVKHPFANVNILHKRPHGPDF